MPKKLTYHDEDGNPYKLVTVKDGKMWHHAFLIEGGPETSEVRWTSTDWKQQVNTCDIDFEPMLGKRPKRGARQSFVHLPETSELIAVGSCSQYSPSVTRSFATKSSNTTSNVQASKRRKNKAIDTNKPLKHTSALHFFYKDVFKHVDEMCPIKTNRKNFWEQLKLQFDYLSKTEREDYVKKAAKDKKRYQDQMAEYETRKKTGSSLDVTKCYIETVTNQIDDDNSTSQVFQETSTKKATKVTKWIPSNKGNNAFSIDSKASITTPHTSRGDTSVLTSQSKSNDATFDTTVKAINTNRSSSKDPTTIKSYILKRSKLVKNKTTGSWRLYYYYDKHRCLGSFASRVKANHAFEILRKKLNQSELIREESIDELLAHISDDLRNTMHGTTEMERKRAHKASAPKILFNLTSVKSNKNTKRHIFRPNRVTAEKNNTWVARFYYDKYRYLGSFDTRKKANLSLDVLRNKLEESSAHTAQSIDEVVRLTRNIVSSRVSGRLTSDATTKSPFMSNHSIQTKLTESQAQSQPFDSIIISSESSNRKQKQSTEKKSHMSDVPKSSKTSDKKDLNSKDVGRKKQKDTYVEHGYHDYSLVPYEDVPSNCISLFHTKHKGGNGILFPEKLHAILSYIAISDPDIISWAPHGRCFSINNREKFLHKCLKSELHCETFSSFQRQLNRYTFKTITKSGSKDKGSYYHELFLRGRPSLSQRLRGIRNKGNGFKPMSSPQDEPDFYSFPYCYEVNQELESNNLVSSQSDFPIASDESQRLTITNNFFPISDTAIPTNTNKSALTDPTTIKKYKFKRVHVYQRNGRNRWKAYFFYDKHRKLGSFATRDEAYDAIGILRNKLYQSNADGKESIDELVAYVRDSLKIKRSTTLLKNSTPIPMNLESTNVNQSKKMSLELKQSLPKARKIMDEKAKEGKKHKGIKHSEGLSEDGRKLDLESNFNEEVNTASSTSSEDHDMSKDNAKEEIIRFNSDLAENPDLTFNELIKKISNNFKNIALSKEDIKRNLHAGKASFKISNNKSITQYDADHPNKNSTSYIYFSNFIREEMKVKYPDASFDELDNLMFLEFEKLTPDDLEIFNELAAKDKNKQNLEIVEHEASQKTEASLKYDTSCHDEKVTNRIEDKLDVSASKASQEESAKNDNLNEWIV